MPVEHVLHGAGAPTVAPPSIGAHYINTSNGDHYLASGTGQVSDWKKQGGSGGSGLTKENFVQHLRRQATGVYDGSVMYSDPAVGALTIASPLGWVQTVTGSGGAVEAQLGPWSVGVSDDDGVSIVGKRTYGRTEMTVTEASDSATMEHYPPEVSFSDLPSPEWFSFDDPNVVHIRCVAQFDIPVLSNSGDEFTFAIDHAILGQSISLRYERTASSNWQVSYYSQGGGDWQVVTSTTPVTANSYMGKEFIVDMVRVGGGWEVKVYVNENLLATLNDVYLEGSGSMRGSAFYLEKLSGTNPRTVWVGSCYGLLELA
ncbi:hypothetical protein D9M68_364090 [compost metagenome]